MTQFEAGSKTTPSLLPSPTVVTALGLLLAVALVLAGAAPASAVPARSFTTELAQPNGAAFKARLYGDEWSHGYEALDGHTIVRNRENGVWQYAVRRDGRLVPSGRRVGLESPRGIPRHLRSSLPNGSPAAQGAIEHRKTDLDSPNLGSQPSLVLLVDYNNQVGATTAADWNAKFFGTSNSVNDYYDEVTYNQLDLPPASETHGTANDGIVGFLRLGTTHPNPEGAFDGTEQQITDDAIVASNPFVNYATFDTNGNGFISSRELHVTVIVAGHETSYGGPGNSCGNSTWGHNWALPTPPTVDGVQVGNAAQGGGYNQFGERHCESGNPVDDHIATIGIMVHEMGHDLQLPDLYDTNGGAEGVGEWSVMGSGSWTQASPTDYPGSSPVHTDAWSKWYEGWLTPLQISGTQTGVALTQNSAGADVIQLLDNPGSPAVDWTFNQNPGTGEYFLVENRQLNGYDAGLPGCGLLIWHIDETRTASNSANSNEARKLVDLEEADGFNDLDNQTNRGDAGDPYLGPKFFNESSNPNSHLYSGAPSGVDVDNISSTCAATMFADFSTVPSVTYDLDVTKSGTGTGTVTGLEINCGSDCSGTYDEGTPVTLTATPSADSKFVSWSGDCSGAGPCVVTMDADHSVDANFIGRTTTTLVVSKTANKIKASGSLNPDHAGSQMIVTFYKKRANGTWRKIATKRPTLNATSDYKASIGRPNSGRCKIKSRFPADSDHLGSSATKQFRC